jgi:hypothetical protein
LVCAFLRVVLWFRNLLLVGHRTHSPLETKRTMVRRSLGPSLLLSLDTTPVCMVPWLLHACTELMVDIAWCRCAAHRVAGPRYQRAAVCALRGAADDGASEGRVHRGRVELGGSSPQSLCGRRNRCLPCFWLSVLLCLFWGFSLDARG